MSVQSTGASAIDWIPHTETPYVCAYMLWIPYAPFEMQFISQVWKHSARAQSISRESTVSYANTFEKVSHSFAIE